MLLSSGLQRAEFLSRRRRFALTRGLQFLEKHRGGDVVLFLCQGDSGSYFLTEATASAVVPFNDAEFSTIEREVENQRKIAEEWPVGDTSAADAKVRKLFRMLTQKETQPEAWEQLLKLSRQDVPAIVRVMSDHQRRIPDFDAFVPTAPGVLAPHAGAHYAPRRVVEAASIVLSYITKAGLWRLNAAYERDPFAEVNGWRVWCAYNL